MPLATIIVLTFRILTVYRDYTQSFFPFIIAGIRYLAADFNLSREVQIFEYLIK
jgi:hypothetical protein